MSLSYENFVKCILNDEENNKDLYDKVTKLSFNSANLKKIQKIIVNFKKATVLNLSQNMLISIPVEICFMSTLTTINLSENNITELPNEICNLVNLETLIVISNKLKTIPSNISKLQNLKNLWLSKNQLVEIPDSIFTMKSLENVRLSHNQINSFCNMKDFFSGKQLAPLTSLFLDNNKISSIPDILYDFISLQKLDLSYNKTNMLVESEQKIKILQDLPDLVFFKNDFNIIGNFCFVCKNECHIVAPCGHKICQKCAEQKLFESSNGNFEITCLECNNIFSTLKLKQNENPYFLKKVTLCTNKQECKCGVC